MSLPKEGAYCPVCGARSEGCCSSTCADALAAPPEVRHFPGCTADYPEKLEGEAAQHLEVIEIGLGETVYQCVDCGAFVIRQERAQRGVGRAG